MAPAAGNGLSIDWGTAAPAVGLPADYFSSRAKGSFTFQHGQYRFTGSGDDAVRILVDGEVAVDTWSGGPSTGLITIPAGTHEVTVESFDTEGTATVAASWEPYKKTPRSPGTGGRRREPLAAGGASVTEQGDSSSTATTSAEPESVDIPAETTGGSPASADDASAAPDVPAPLAEHGVERGHAPPLTTGSDLPRTAQHERGSDSDVDVASPSPAGTHDPSSAEFRWQWFALVIIPALLVAAYWAEGKRRRLRTRRIRGGTR